MRKFYATYNSYGNLREGSHGFLNTWEIKTFPNQKARNQWVDENENRLARAVTRREAIEIFAACYHSVGKPVPTGGLMAEIHRERI
jgi:hypothetical protein